MFWRRRFYKSPISTVPAGEKRCLIRHKGKINVRQFNLFYDGDNDTGTPNCILTITIDGEQILNTPLVDINFYYGGGTASYNLAAPVTIVEMNWTEKRYKYRFLDLGTVKENIEIWFENVDTSNSAKVYSAIIYDVYEEGK